MASHVVEAIKNLAERGGSSRVKIQQYIDANFGAPRKGALSQALKTLESKGKIKAGAHHGNTFHLVKGGGSSSSSSSGSASPKKSPAAKKAKGGKKAKSPSAKKSAPKKKKASAKKKTSSKKKASPKASPKATA